MPVIRVEMLAGRTDEQKRTFAREVTKLACETFNCKPDTLHVVFSEVPRNSWATAGTLQSDKS